MSSELVRLGEVTVVAAGCALALAAVPGTYAYFSNWATSTAFGSALIAGKDPQQYALTFDDGPNGDTTLRLLDILAMHDARASFFLIGKYVREQPHIARRVLEAGHLVANHTDTHPHLARLHPRKQRREIEACSETLRDVLGVEPKFFRTPFGSRGPATLRIVRELGLTPVMWNCVGWDWELKSGERIAQSLLRGAARAERRCRGSNLLLHDGSHRGLGWDRDATLEAVSLLLSRVEGKRWVTVDEF